MLKHLGFAQFEPAIEGIVLGVMIVIVWFVFNAVKKKGVSNEYILEIDDIKIMKNHLVARGVILMMWFVLSFGVIFINS